jgi:hypothetical protein
MEITNLGVCVCVSLCACLQHHYPAVSHSPYSPDLGPSDIHVIRK